MNLNKKTILLNLMSALILFFSWKWYLGNDFIIGNTINGIHFGLLFMIFGFCIGLFLICLLAKKRLLYTSTGLTFIALVIPVMLSAKIGYDINKKFGEKIKAHRTAIVGDKIIDIIPLYPRISIEFKNNAHRLLVSRELWEQLNTGDIIQFNVQKGYFGFDILTDIVKYE